GKHDCDADGAHINKELHKSNEEAAKKIVKARDARQGQRQAQDVVEDISGKYRDRGACNSQGNRAPEGRLHDDVQAGSFHPHPLALNGVFRSTGRQRPGVCPHNQAASPCVFFSCSSFSSTCFANLANKSITQSDCVSPTNSYSLEYCRVWVGHISAQRPQSEHLLKSMT